MILPAARTSPTSLFIRSSNSPLYLEPAISAAKSKEKIRLSLIFSGTASFAIRCAIPSMIAVLPTPGSPTIHGLFFVLRLKICISLCISSSRPTTGSSLPSSARAFRSVQNCSNTEPLPVPSPRSDRAFGFSPIVVRQSCIIF